jgi:hypothetical protein
MTTQLWIGFGFLTALVIFLIVSFFLAPRLTNDQRGTLKFLTALCAGVAGGFLSGASVFQGEWTTPTSKIALSGTAGFALFFVVWFFYPKVFKLDDAVALQIPPNCSFRQAVDLTAQSASAAADYRGFQPAELGAPMVAEHVSAKTLEELIGVLRLKTSSPGAIRDYKVARNGAVYRLTVE